MNPAFRPARRLSCAPCAAAAGGARRFGAGEGGRPAVARQQRTRDPRAYMRAPATPRDGFSEVAAGTAPGSLTQAPMEIFRDTVSGLPVLEKSGLRKIFQKNFRPADFGFSGIHGYCLSMRVKLLLCGAAVAFGILAGAANHGHAADCTDAQNAAVDAAWIAYGNALASLDGFPFSQVREWRRQGKPSSEIHAEIRKIYKDEDRPHVSPTDATRADVTRTNKALNEALALCR